MKWHCQQLDAEGDPHGPIHVLDFAFGGPTDHNEAAESFAAQLVEAERKRERSWDDCDWLNGAQYPMAVCPVGTDDVKKFTVTAWAKLEYEVTDR